MKKSPITFLIPAFNVEQHLKSCLEGIYSQTFTNFKALIINDGSTDGTEETLRQINDSRFCVIHRKKNMGYIYCLNLGLTLIKTKYTARLDADDIPMPRRLENQISFLEKNPEVSVVGSRMAYIYGAKQIFGIRLFGKQIIPSFCPRMSERPFWNPAIDGETIPHSSATFRTGQIRKAGGYRKLYPAEDMDLWYRLAAEGKKLACLPEILTLYRINPQGATSSALFRQAMITEFVKRSLYLRTQNKSMADFKKFSKCFQLSPSAAKTLKLKSNLRRAMGSLLNQRYIPAIWIFLGAAFFSPAALFAKIKSRFFINDPWPNS
jgi:glycosyltransferase involved in cell wall biosynthesis